MPDPSELFSNVYVKGFGAEVYDFLKSLLYFYKIYLFEIQIIINEES